MQGIVLTSHGEMAKGLLQTTTLFFGEQAQITARCLMPDDNPDEFVDVLKQAINDVDTGDGVIVMCDMLFGSPCNCMARVVGEDLDDDKVQVLCGVNLAMVLQMLATREAQHVSPEELVEAAHQGIADLKATLKASM
jgi:mannose PTS system EIIA component